ncbi:MAG: hypothetical protein GTO51_07120 [Candidatus Latescibacteria bacterium]|nr:hypothetical protein [Candidatus Latescibacterota bacterium]NIM22264.1 hypothetical protein [Candidatus Latescibacterota bacterium]NIM65743.1 hypothetical protein [Candidatus Latescibacterota bacterium]NIO02128.1 hypothetical protein [Candidatus Latescibacterota bacterium]NIO28960.1 hypothetical protein [Candidatus Latescibacterota bacterium]
MKKPQNNKYRRPQKNLNHEDSESRKSIENPAENPLDQFYIEAQAAPDPWSISWRRPSRLFLLGFFAVMIGYALWLRSPSQNVQVSHYVDRQIALRSARIYPNLAYALNTLKIRLEDRYWTLQDSFTCQWFRNGQPIIGGSGRSLGPENFRKGDEIWAEVRLMGPTDSDKPYTIPRMKISNTPPQILSAATLVQGDPNHVIGADVQSRDVDGDSLRYIFTWFKNGKRIPDATRPTMDASLFQRGDKIYAEIVADDGDDKSSPTRSDPLKVENSSPRILSKPPQSTEEGNLFVYHLQAEDADGDPLSYKLVQSPSGMTIDRTGKILWTFPMEERKVRSYRVEVRVSDAKGAAATQTFEITLAAVKQEEAN